MRTRLTAFLLFFSLFATRLMADESSLDSLRARSDSINATAGVVPIKAQTPRPPRFSFLDSLSHRMLSPRLNLRDAVAAGRQKNPGEYLRSEPSQFIMNTSSRPVRTTVYPYGVSGDRLGTVINGIDMRPFEHVVQPDGAIDMNDIPSLSDDNIYLLPGQVGQLFGSSHGLATMLTQPDALSDTRAHTAMLVDKGGFGYSQVRGKFHTRFTDGREVLLGIGYRSSDGVFTHTEDDSYHYIASFVQPVNARLSIFADGNMYHRNGLFMVAPDTSGAYVDRTRLDRNLKAGISLQNDTGTYRFDLGYMYRHGHSDLKSFYRAKFDNTTNGAFASWEGARNTLLYRVTVTGDYEKWEDGTQFKDQTNGSLLGSLSFDYSEINAAIQAGTRYTEDFDALPTVTAAASYEQPHWYLLASIGYDEQPPSLHDRFLRYRQVPFKFYDVNAYADSGNADLKKEKQIVGSLLWELGSPTNALRLSVTAGSISDAIDWKRAVITSGADTISLFTPINHDVTFTSVSANIRQTLFAHFMITLGGTKYWYGNDSLPKHPYRPDYNCFAGGEFHVYWPKTGVDLYAYGELLYSGPYDGYVRTGLGQNVVANSKLSLGIRRFRFYFGTDNIFLASMQDRESFNDNSRTMLWGFTWQFTD